MFQQEYKALTLQIFPQIKQERRATPTALLAVQSHSIMSILRLWILYRHLTSEHFGRWAHSLQQQLQRLKRSVFYQPFKMITPNAPFEEIGLSTD